MNQFEIIERTRLVKMQEVGIKAASKIAKMHREIMMLSDNYIVHCIRQNPSKDIQDFASTM
jgi:hypothetical protein